MYNKIKENLHQASNDDATNVVVITGTGDFYCSGNDLSSFMGVSDPAAMAKQAHTILE